MNFTRIRYPDGQISAKFVKTSDVGEDNFMIRERINSYEDLFYIRSIADIINSGAVNALHTTQSYRLVIPCLFGQRSDRRFDKNQSFDLKLICDIINECKFGKVSIFDPHSNISLALINNSEKISSLEYVKRTIDKIDEKNLTLVSPDAGAFHKVFEFGKELNLPVMGAMKHRDRDGNIDLIFTHDVKDKTCLIVDDLCSRGNTFIQLSSRLRDQGAKKIYLYISHFEGGCEEYKKTVVNLRKSIDWIYTTNTFREFDEEDQKTMTIYKVI